MREIVTFQHPVAGSWNIVNDGVMGGVSSSSFELTDHGSAAFTGFLSLDNNGGFASVRGRFEAMDLSGHAGVLLKVKGDGRTYDLRLWTDGNLDGVAYRAEFTPPAGEWTEVALRFSEFQPSWRGRVPRGAGPLDTTAIRQVGILIGDKKEGPFALEVAWIRALPKTT